MKLLELCYSKKPKTKTCSTLLFNTSWETETQVAEKEDTIPCPSLAWGGANYFFFLEKKLSPQFPCLSDCRS